MTWIAPPSAERAQIVSVSVLLFVFKHWFALGVDIQNGALPCRNMSSTVRDMTQDDIDKMTRLYVRRRVNIDSRIASLALHASMAKSGPDLC